MLSIYTYAVYCGLRFRFENILPARIEPQARCCALGSRAGRTASRQSV